MEPQKQEETSQLEPSSRVNLLCWAEVGLKPELLTAVLSFPRTPTYHPPGDGDRAALGTDLLWRGPQSALVTQNQAAPVEQDNTALSFTAFPSALLTWSGERRGGWGCPCWQRSVPFSLCSMVGKSKRPQAKPVHRRAAG